MFLSLCPLSCLDRAAICAVTWGSRRTQGLLVKSQTKPRLSEKDAYKAVSGNCPFHMLCLHRGEILCGLRECQKGHCPTCSAPTPASNRGKSLKKVKGMGDRLGGIFLN